MSNLVHELSAVDEEFRLKLQRLIDYVLEELGDSLRNAKARRYVAMAVDYDAAAAFIVASTEGAAGLAKGSCDPSAIRLCQRGMTVYLAALRPNNA